MAKVKNEPSETKTKNGENMRSFVKNEKDFHEDMDVIKTAAAAPVAGASGIESKEEKVNFADDDKKRSNAKSKSKVNNEDHLDGG